MYMFMRRRTTPKETPNQIVNVVKNTFRDKGGLHGIIGKRRKDRFL